MKLTTIILLPFTVLFALGAIVGCKKARAGGYHGDSLKTDKRYSRVIEFKSLDLRVPLDEDSYLRMDGPVEDPHRHLRSVLAEFGIPSAHVVANDSGAGMQMHLRFRDGKQCSFIWAKQFDDPRIVRSCIEHEKLHAVYSLKPQALRDISAAISRKGFRIDVAALKEEVAAELIEVLSMHGDGVLLEAMSGDENTMKAIELLKANRIAPSESDPAKPH